MKPTSKLRDLLALTVFAVLAYLWVDEGKNATTTRYTYIIENNNVQHSNRQLDNSIIDIHTLFHDHLASGCQEELSQLKARHKTKNFWSNVQVYQTEVELMQSRPEQFVRLPKFDVGNHTRGGLAIFKNAIIQGPTVGKTKPAIYDCLGSIYQPGGCPGKGSQPAKAVEIKNLVNMSDNNALPSVNNGVVIFLGQVWDIAYYHSQVEILPKLLYLLPYLQQQEDQSLPTITILVPPTLSESRIEFISELLGLGRGIVWESFRAGNRYLAPKLIVPTATRCGNANPHLMEAFQQIMDRNAPSMLAEEIGSIQDEHELSSSRPLMLVHVRKRRNVLNHKELMEALQERYGHRFAIVPFTGAESPKATAAIHRLASIIVAPHGAGLANMIYCRRGATSVIEMHPPSPDSINHCHETTATGLGLPYKMVVAPGNKGFASFDADIGVVLGEVQLAIERLGHDETAQSSLRALSFADPKTVENRVPHQFTTTAKKCSSPVDVPKTAYKSQEFEDTKLMKWFGTICEGTYIEMGALNGILFSNSHVFNKGGLGWKGVLIELMKHNYDELVKNRPNEIATINAGVCDVPQKLHYFGGTNQAVGGIYEFTVSSFRERWWKGISVDDPKMQEIQCDTLDNLLIQHAPENTFFDFFSLDVEGAELAVLRSIDFERVGFGIIFLEADQHNELKNLAMRELLESKGYIFLEVFSRSYWFVHHQFHEIYHDLIY